MSLKLTILNYFLALIYKQVFATLPHTLFYELMQTYLIENLKFALFIIPIKCITNDIVRRKTSISSYSY